MVRPSSALTKTCRPSGENTACSGFLPGTFTTCAWVVSRVSTNTTSLDSSTATATQRPSGEMSTPSGESPTWMASMVRRPGTSMTSKALLGASLT
jgi:hypothetical protein